MLLHYGDGRVLACVLLSLNGAQMRVAVKDADDVLEIQLINGLWISESCDPVTFEFPTAVFGALGIVPDERHMNRQPELFWHRPSMAVAVDPRN